MKNKLTLTHVFETYHLNFNGQEYEVRINATNNRCISKIFENGVENETVNQDVFDYINTEIAKIK